MSSREGLRLARAIKQQLGELRAGRAAPNALAAAVELHTWTRKRISPEEEADRQPLSPALHSTLEELVPLLADVAAALVPAVSGTDPLDGSSTVAVSACCDLLGTLLVLCGLGLRLTERDALRLLTVGALPLQTRMSGGPSEERAFLLDTCCLAVQVLVDMSDHDTPLPPRAATAARRTVLRPQVLAGWLNHTAAAAAEIGAQDLGDHTRDLMGAAQAVCSVRSVIPLLQPPVQEALVGLAAAMVEHQAQPERLAEGAPIVRASFGLPVVLPLGRMRHEQNSGARLLAAVAGSLAARLQAAGQQAQRETADAAGRPAHPVLLQAVVGALPHVLAALHRLSDLVNAASAAAGLGDGGGVGGGSSGGLEAPADPNSFIGRLLRDPDTVNEVFSDSLLGLVDALAHLDELKSSMPGWSSCQVCAAALTTTDLVMRLLPRLRRWPVLLEAAGRPPTIVAADAAPQPTSAIMSSILQRNPRQALGVTLGALSFTLCATAANSQGSSLGSGEHAPAAFHTAMAACKWEHWQAGQQGAAAFFLPKLAGEPIPLAMHPACLAAQRLWHMERWLVHRSGGDAEREAEAQRRLDCVLLTYIDALTARPAGMSQTDVVQPRMLALCDWINWPSEVAATDLLLADGCRGARLLMQTLADALEDATCPNEMVFSMFHFVLQRSQPSLLPVAAANPDLLRWLAAAAAQPGQLGWPIPGQRSTAEPALTSIARPLLRWLQRCARQLQASGDTCGSSGSGSSGSSAVVAKLIEVDVDAASLSEMARLLSLYCRSPLLPEASLLLPQPAANVDELALRRARALALRACANPRCTKLGGDSEAALKGRRCSGCRLVRYCCEACSKQDWQAHKRACRLLRSGMVVS